MKKVFDKLKRPLPFLIALLLLTSCSQTTDAGSSDSSPSAAETQSAESAGGETQSVEVTTLIVGGPSSFDTVSYYDENGTLTGFEVELLRKIDEYLPEYEFDFQPSSDLSAIFLGVETEKIDIAYCQIEWNEERATKYLYTNESYCNFPLRITVLGDRDDINGIEDLWGKKVQVNTGGNDAYVMEQYNKENGDQIELVYATPDATITDTNLKNGSIDAYIGVERYVLLNNEVYGFNHKVVGDVVKDSLCYFVTNLENTELRDRLDEAIAALKADGTIQSLSEEFFGGDYVP